MQQSTSTSLETTADFNKQALLYILSVFGKPRFEPATRSILPIDYTCEDFSKFIAGLMLEILRDEQIPELDSQGQKQFDNNGDLIYTTRLKYIRKFIEQIPHECLMLFSVELYDQDLNQLRPFVETTLYNILTAPYDQFNQRLYTYALQPKVTPHRISQQDIQFIELMLQHKKLRECILLMNQIGDYQEALIQTHINELLDYLKLEDVYLMKDFPIYGMTSFRRKLYFNEKLFIIKNTASEYQKDQIRVIRLITIIQEIFFLFMRPKLGFINEPLKDTYELASYQKETIKEIGTFMEINLFGSFVEKNMLTEEFIQRFFCKQTWSQSLNIDITNLQNQGQVNESNKQSQKNLSRRILYDDSSSEEGSSSDDGLPSVRCIRAHQWLMEQRRKNQVNKEQK